MEGTIKANEYVVIGFVIATSLAFGNWQHSFMAGAWMFGVIMLFEHVTSEQ